MLLTFMAATGLLIVRLHSMFAIVMLGGIFSLLASTMFVVLDAVDVALTEAAVGAGITTVLMLAVLGLTAKGEEAEEKIVPLRRSIIPLIVVVSTGIALIYGTLDMPHYGDPNAPAHTHVAPTYLAEATEKTTVPNVVTAILASYRGFDTLGEVIVIFAAAVGVMLLLAARRRRRQRPGGSAE